MSMNFVVLLSVFAVLGVLGLGIKEGNIMVSINWGTFLFDFIKNVIYGALVTALLFWVEYFFKVFL